MADANEMHETIMRELKNVVICDTDQTEEELESVLYDEDADFQDFPPSLLRYFETSKSRAAVCEKLIREEPEAEITALHHTEDMMNCHIEADKDMMTPNEQVICGSENEENNTSTDIRPLPAPTETESLFTHNVSVCPNNEDEAGTNKHMESERHLAFEMRMPNKSIDYEAEQDKQKSKEMNEEQKTQIERDFQRELRKIMDAEKRHQKELELMEKRAQEKLEQEFLLQQEVISNLQRRVEEERRMREDEQKRMKDEKDKRKREEEKLKMEAERRRMEEETRRKKEEDRKIEMKRKKEEERKNKEEEMKKMAREEKKREEDGRKKIELQKKKLEDETRMIEEEEMRKKKEEVERIKREEERGKREEEIKKIGEAREEWEKMEKQKREMEEQSVKKEDEWRKKDGKERKKMEKENMGIEEEGRVTKEIKERKKQEQMREKNENDEADDRKEVALEKMYEEMGKGDKREQGKVDELKLEERKMKNENYTKKMKKEEKEEVKKKEMERKKMEEKNDGKEVVRKQEGEHRKIKEMRSNEEDEKRKFEDERETKEEEQRRLQKETRQKDDEDDRKAEEEMRLHTDDNEGYVDNRKTKDTEKKNEKSKNGNAEKEKNEEEVGEKKEEVNEKMQEEMRLKEKEIKMRMVQNRENEVRVIRANEVQKKIEDDGIIGQNESVVQPETSSQTEDGTTCTSSSPGPLQSTICPTTNEAMPPQYDKNICQTSTDETVDCENQAAKPSSGSVRLAACLSEHTEQKRLSWMKDCIPWSDLSLQNRRKHRVPAWSKRGPRRAAEASSLLPLSPGSLLQSTSWKSLQEVTTVTLEDLPGCSLSTLAQCPQLQSLSLRRCGLKSLEGLNQLQQLCYIDVQENDISYVDCENMPSLRVLHLGHNKLTSVHGLAGAGNLDVLELSHNSITRIAGLESMRRLQRLSVDHNQLISTKGLKDVYTLLHLNCSHNHLARVEGLENNALLNTLDLRANSLTEPPSLNNQVLLRELYLDDNSISSLQGLAACWLPLMQHLSVAQNRITQLPPVSDALSLSNLDLRFNCMSELQNVCESLEGCQFLREIRLTGNPLQQENDWRSSLQRAVPGLRAIDDQETDSYLSPPAVQQVGSASDSFLMFCQAQIQESRDLQRRHRRELSNVSSSLDAVKISCRHFTETLQLATDQRFAHEYGDTTVADKHRTADQTAPEETLDVESTGKASPFTPNSDRIGCSYQTFDEKPVVESWHDIFDTGPKTVPTVSKASSGSLHSLAMKNKTSSNLEMAPVSNYQDLDLKNTAAVVIQQRWRKYRQKCENLSSPITAEKGGGGGGEPESGPPYINRRVVGQDYAATVIQAFWRGFTLRRRLTSALAAVTCLDTGGDDTFEEVDINEFVFDEAELENNWTLPLSEDSPPRYYPVSERPLHLKPRGPFPEPSQYILSPPVVWQAKQAWVAPEQVDSCVQRVSPVSSNRSSSPASASVVSRLSERSEKILEEWGFTHSHTALLMLKRAQRMKAKKQHQKKHRDPSIHLASFRHRSCQPGKVEVRNRQAQDNRNYIKAHTLFQPPSSIQNEIQPHQTSVLMSEGHEAGEAELGPGQAEKQQEGAHSDSESVHFLPEISPDILNGGRVQLVADPGYAECLHHASGLRANSSLAGQPSKESDYPHRNSLSHGTEKVPSPKQATSAPSKRERISFRDNPVRMSGGWGGGKKRNKI